MRRSIRSVRSATSSSPSPSRHSCAPYASPTAMRTIEIGAWTPPSGTTPGMRRPVRTITLPPISSRRMRFGEPTSSRPSGVIVAAFSPRPASRIAAAASWTTPFRVAAIAVRLINLTWFRVGSERYVRESNTYGVTTLTKRHVSVRGKRVSFRFQTKHGYKVRTALVDMEIAVAVKDLLKVRGGRQLFRYEHGGELHNLTGRKLNDYIQRYMGEEFTAKDFRTWGGTLEAAIAFAELGDPPDTAMGQKRAGASVLRRVAERLGNTPAVTRASYVNPAVVEQYLDGRTIDDFRPRHLRVVGARDIGLDLEEQALVSLLRSWRIRRAREAA